jgi:hypothetical protein
VSAGSSSVNVQSCEWFMRDHINGAVGLEEC